MPNVLIRNIPDQLHAKIQRGYQKRMVSQNAYLLSLISNAFEKAGGPTLFDLADDGLAPQDVTWSVPFAFVDLFSGIGGMRLGLEASGGQCIFFVRS